VLPFHTVEIREYLDWTGRSPYGEWFESLSAQAAAKVAVAVTRLAQANFSNVKGVGGGVYECRVNFGPGLRIYFGKDGERLVIVLAGGTKKRRQKTLRTRRPDGKTTRRENFTGNSTMPLTRDFKQTIQARVRRDVAFRKELLREGVECLVLGDIETGKSVLRDYINATIGFAELAKVTQHSAKSLMRMLSPMGNPQALNLFEIVEYLQRKERVRFKVATAAR
jgi:putative addiction module killer protein